jgi:hypothetical protein
MDSKLIFMAHGLILKHLEVDKLTWGVIFFFKEGRPPLRVALTAFLAGKRAGAPFFS